MDPIAVVCTQYWAGVGNQAALLVGAEGMIGGPATGKGAINKVLAALGVQRAEGVRDEFDVIGLSRWGGTDEILDDAG
jgi:hypothetical protein